MINKNDCLLARKILFAFLITGILGLIIGTFYDLEINQVLFNRGSFFSDFFKGSGEIPMTLLIMAASFSLIRINFLEKRRLERSLLPIIIIIAFSFVSARTIPGYFKIDNQIISVSITMAYLLVSYSLSLLVKNKDAKDVRKYASFIIFIVLTSLFVMFLMKNIWGRQRFISLIETNNLDNFTRWYKPQSWAANDSFKSFPSGHTSSAATVLVLLFYRSVFKENKYKILIIAFAILFPILVFFSRMVDGAHYLTDVSMAFVLVSLITLLYSKKFFEMQYVRNN